MGATFAVFERGDASRPLIRAGYHEAGRGGAEFRVILATPPIPAELWVAKPELDASLGHAQIIAAFEALERACPDALQSAFEERVV